MSLFRIWLLMILLVTIWLDESHLMRLKRNKTREREALRQSEKLSRNLGLNEARTEKEIKIDEKLDKIRVRDDSKEDVASEDESDDDDDDEEDEEDERDTSGAEKERREEKTNKGPKIWDQWGKWSPCSVTCGIGKITRWRHCVGGGCAPGEKEAQIKTCTLPAWKDKARREDKVGKGPKIWDQWSKWSPCSVTCGIGKITRWRHCISGGCAPGEKEAQIKTCTLPPC